MDSRQVTPETVSWEQGRRHQDSPRMKHSKTKRHGRRWKQRWWVGRSGGDGVYGRATLVEIMGWTYGDGGYRCRWKGLSGG